MSLEKQNFGMVSGDSKKIIVTVTDTDGNIVNLTGATIKWVIKARVNVEKSTDLGSITITNAEEGTFQIELLPSDTSDLSGNYSHSAEITDSNENISTIFTGIISLTTRIV